MRFFKSLLSVILCGCILFSTMLPAFSVDSTDTSSQTTPLYGDVDGDGDPLDICVLTEKDVTHGDILVNARPIGGLRLLDHNQADDKIIAVLRSDAVYGHMTDIDQVPMDIIRRLIHYFSTYKDIPGEHTSRMQFISIYGPEVAKDVIVRSMEDYNDLIAEK
jgi:inorganic pyrophosphatase